jgi:glyoxylase-like metal-dependent hydrolase (beta-lactamase superfamily II)
MRWNCNKKSLSVKTPLISFSLPFLLDTQVNPLLYRQNMKRVKITERIEYLIPENAISRFLCSGMIINDSAKVFLDANFGKADTRALLLSEKPDFALISHYHLDHSWWGGLVRAFSHAALFVPAGEEAYLKDLGYFLEMTQGHGHPALLWANFVREEVQYKAIDHFTPYDSTLDLGLRGVRMSCLPAPGHSPSHMVVYFPDQKILFTSDLGLGPFGPWYGFKDCDITLYVDSLLRLKGMNPRLLLTGHEGIIRKGIDAVFERCIGSFFMREALIRRKLEKGLSRDEIIGEGVYFLKKEKAQGSLKDFLTMWDGVMFDHHLKKIREGGLKKDFPRDQSHLARSLRGPSCHQVL